MIELRGFVPDVDPATPGVVVDASNAIPTANGMRGAPTTIVYQPPT